MRARLRIASVNGSYSVPSKTGALVTLITEEFSDRFDVEADHLDMADVGTEFAAARAREDLGAELQAMIRKVETADLVIAATPVFRGSYTGLFKHFFDLVDQYALANTFVMLVATGGSERHALVIEHALRPLFGFFQAATVPVGIYASSGDFGGTEVLNPEVHARIRTAVEDITPALNRDLAMSGAAEEAGR
ncbi:FMN reductase [Citricoccus sp. GCM10030269]|uniref:FMN reductase n=1 Tax=Citricoccus sp. GCM10030269 TaxID=3273388 RepID=UPI0036135E26